MIYNIPYNEDFIEVLAAKANDALLILPGKYLTDVFKNRGLHPMSYDDLWFKILPSRASHIAESVIIDRVIKGHYPIKNDLRNAINEFFYYGLNIKDLVCINSQHDLLKQTIVELYKLLEENNLSLRASTLQNILNSQLYLDFKKPVYVLLPVIFSPLLFKILQLFREKFNFNLVMHGYDKSIDYRISPDHPQYFMKEFLRAIKVDQDQVVDINQNTVKFHPDAINRGLSQVMYPAKILYRLHNETLYQLNHIEKFTTQSIAEEFRGILSIIEKSDARNISIVSKKSDKLKLLYSYLKGKLQTSKLDYHIRSSTPTYCYDYQQLRLFFLVLDVIGTYEITLTAIFDLLKQSKYDQDMIFSAEKTLLETETLYDKDIQYAEKILEDNQLFEVLDLVRQVISFRDISNIQGDFDLPIQLSDNSFDRLLKIHMIAYITVTGYQFDEKLIQFLIEVQTSIGNWHFSFIEYKNTMLELGMRTIISSDSTTTTNDTINIDLLTAVERRFLSYDLTIICDLKEGIWPPATEDHFFISEYTRRIVGYIRPANYEVGYAAHDFISIIASSKKIIISELNTSEIFSQDVLKKPLIDSRFLSILDGYRVISGVNTINSHIDKLRDDELQLCSEAIMDIPVEHRPKSLSATSLEKLMKNPYLYSLEYNLHLKYLPKCFNQKVQFPSNKEFGIILHNILHKTYYREDYNDFCTIFQSIIKTLVSAKYGPKTDYMMTFWQVKFNKIMQFIYNYNQKLYSKHNDNIKTETEKSIAVYVKVGQNNIKLQARADRLDWTQAILYITDYKTGQLPSKKEIITGQKIQLNLEALIITLLQNNFDLMNDDVDDLKMQDIVLRYIRLTGIESTNTIMDIDFDLKTTLSYIKEIFYKLYVEVIPYSSTDKYDNYLQGHIMRIFNNIEHKC